MTNPEVAVVSANLGYFDKTPGRLGVVTDQEYAPRHNSMTPRLQARIVKMFMWQFRPGYKYYLWVDSSCELNPGGVEWFLKQLGDADIAVFAHPHRKTVQEEADYLKARLAKDCPYITPRYWGEDIDGQMEEVRGKDRLLASTAFIYKDSPQVRAMMKEWWYHTSRYHSIDQLSLPFVLDQSDCTYKVIEENYLKVPALTYTRNKV